MANDPDRLARFSREAQVLASLSHPNIAHIHGLEEAGGMTALVLELVEGEDRARGDAARRSATGCATDRGRFGVGSRARHHPPRSQTGEHHGATRRYRQRTYDVSPDGQRFLMIKNGTTDGNAPPPSLVVVEHWFEDLKRLVPSKP